MVLLCTVRTGICYCVYKLHQSLKNEWYSIQDNDYYCDYSDDWSDRIESIT